MAAGGQYQLGPEAVRATVGNVGGIIMQTVNVVLDLESMIVTPTSFATIGSAVASANTSMQAQQVVALRSLLKLLQDVNSLVKQSADAYDSADQAVSSAFGGTNHPAATTPSTGLWSSGGASQLAGVAIGDSMGGCRPAARHGHRPELPHAGRPDPVAARCADRESAGVHVLAGREPGQPGVARRDRRLLGRGTRLHRRPRRCPQR